MNDEILAVTMREQELEVASKIGFAPDDICDELRAFLEKRLNEFDAAVMDGDFIEAMRGLLGLRLGADMGMLMCGIKPTETYSQLLFCGLGNMNSSEALKSVLEAQGWKPNTHAE